MKKIRSIAYIMFLLLSVNVFAFKMDRITFNKSLENGYQEYVIHNDGTQKVRYKVSIEPSGDEDITDALEISPKILTIEPKSYKVLKIFGKSKRKLENKEYPFMVNFKQILIPTLKKAEDGKISGSAGMSLAPSVQMKGHGGIIDYSKALELTDVKFEKNKDGNLVFKGKLKNSSHGATGLGIIFANKTRKITTSQGLGGIEGNSTRNLEIVVDNFTNENQIKYIEFYNENYENIKTIIRE